MPLKRMNVIKVHLDDAELKRLNYDVEKTGLSRESYIRTLINGYVPNVRPSEDYLKVLNLLRITSNNMNQIAILAHRTGIIDAEGYKSDVQRLKSIIAEIKIENNRLKKVKN